MQKWKWHGKSGSSRALDVGAIPQEHIGKDAPVLVLAVGLEDDISPEDERGRRLLGVVAVGLTFLRAVDAAEADTLRVHVVQHFDGVAVEDGDHGAGEVGSCEGSTQEKKDTGTAEAKTGCCPTS